MDSLVFLEYPISKAVMVWKPYGSCGFYGLSILFRIKQRNKISAQNLYIDFKKGEVSSDINEGSGLLIAAKTGSVLYS